MSAASDIGGSPFQHPRPRSLHHTRLADANNDLAPRGFGRPRSVPPGSARRGRAHFLECLGQFAPYSRRRDRRPRIPAIAGKRVGEPPRQPQRRSRSPGQPSVLQGGSGAGRPWPAGESGEHERVRRQARHRRARQNRRRSGNWNDLDAALQRHLQPAGSPGSEISGVPASDTRATLFPVSSAAISFGPASTGIVFVIGKGALANAIPTKRRAGHTEYPRRPARVRAGQVDTKKRVMFGQIADRRRDEIERRRERPRGDFRLRDDVGFLAVRAAIHGSF